ncbi:glycosyltransferase [Xanthomonas sp. NCPPB 2654]|uniref:glycosyltransferase n=1 Tax=Xanthomonas sp. NCPPB 2654 TaxID=487541 RepID=UPI00256F0AF5|nr:glycosyltransferase [Xanthomonas sp. NCPPB 2654]MDL5365240.1 glycosyltransferase [Xanthomonas sp. NCPPB 2654]
MTDSEPANIWLLLSRFGHGGLERVQVALANGLCLRGHHVKLVAGQVLVHPDGLTANVPVLEIAPSGPFHFLSGFLRGWRRQAPDVIFTTSNDVACLVLLLKLLYRKPVRVVVTQHLSVSGPRIASRGARRVKLELLMRAMRLLFPRADSCVAVSEAVASDMRSELGLSPDKVSVIHNPVVAPDCELRSLQQVDWPWPDRSVPTVVFVGRFSPEKRLDLLLRAFSRVLTQKPARLLLIGTGPLESRVSQWMNEAGLGATCERLGYVANPLPYIRQADVLVLCSDYEGFGNVLVEAMACGTQVVSTDCPDGPREILEDGRLGQLVRCGDHDALAEALIRVIDGRCRVEPDVLRRRAAEFGVQKSIDAYEELVAGLRPRIRVRSRSPDA